MADTAVTYPLTQACQTQTTLRAPKATKTAKGASEIRKNPEWATLKKLVIFNA